MDTNKLYQIKRLNFREDSGAIAGIIVKGDTVDIQVYGSQLKPTLLTDMVDICNGISITSKGAYTFSMLPEYIYLDGDADSFELVNYVEEKDLGDFS